VGADKFRGVNIANGLYQVDDRAGVPSTNTNNGTALESLKIDTRPLTMGITNNITYKSFTLSFFVQLTRQAGKNYLFDPIFTSQNAGAFFTDLFGNLPVQYLDYWKSPGQIAEFQRITSLPFGHPQRNLRDYVNHSDKAWVDASFIRLRNATFSYALPKVMLKKLKINNLSLYVQAQNLLTITDYKGLDPETQSATALPLLRTIVGGIQIAL
ncbi:MAG: hypothetical protein J7497_07600, partial [Chitinophagaceae bacterium]|nr:hypothetical protein [Chitinophagaceae bacterium]